MNWIVTVPKTIDWVDYQFELDAVKDGHQVMNYRVPYRPKCKVGDRMYVVHDGFVKGWMKIIGINYRELNFMCTTTGKTWSPGWYIQRSGEFHKLDKPIKMTGFRGLRRFNG